MAGNNELEKRLNKYLTSQFIGFHEVPEDECLTEAREVIKIVREYDEEQRKLNDYDILLTEIAEAEGMIKDLPENAIIERKGLEHRVAKARSELNKKEEK